MIYDDEKIEEAVLALLGAFAFSEQGEIRSWKTFDFNVTDRLFERGLIHDPRGHARSIQFTSRGIEAAQTAAARLFGVRVPGPSFRLSRVSAADLQPMPPVSELLASVRASPSWDEASIVSVGEQYPRLHLAWQSDRGFVIHCFQDAESPGHFLVEGGEFSAPEVEVALGGQALERWPRQLFVSERLAREAVEHFLCTGRRTLLHAWVETGGFPRQTVWEGREQRKAWEAQLRGAAAPRAEGPDAK